MKKRSLILLILVGISAALIIYFYGRPFVGAKTQIFDNRVKPTKYHLNHFTVDRYGNAFGSSGNKLYRIVDNGDETELVYEFPDNVNGIHVMDNGTFIVATDDNWWDPRTPCRIYRSTANSAAFELIKTIEKSSALWWSIASDRKGNLYIGEYGPKDRDLSKNVWKSTDYGDTWDVTFKAPNRIGVHIHRVAVDPFTDFLWVTHGDKYDGTYVSRDCGMTWENVREAQPTAVAFTQDAIYWGEDTRKGIVTRYDRLKKKWKTVLKASKLGTYGGSIYDMAVGRGGLIYAPLVKYPNHDHLATLWVSDGQDWRLLMTLESEKGKSSGATSIGGPDKYGMLYITGFKIEDRNQLH